MIPSSLVGLILFVVLLTPGFAYVLRIEKRVAGREFSPLREAFRAVFVSVVFLLVTGLLFGLLRWWLPARTPNVRGLVRDPVEFAREHHVHLAWWALAFMVSATTLAALAADHRVQACFDALGSTRFGRAITGARDDDIRAVSHWARVLELYADDPGPILVGIQLEDGSYVTGRVWNYNPGFDEDQDREIILQQPLTLTRNSRVEVEPLGAQFTIISARRVMRIDVTHLPPGYDFANVPPHARETQTAE